MATFKITLAYDGTEFSGWQLQPGQRTVQGVLEVILRQLTGQTVRVRGASRTDSGVHALGQVAAFSLQSRLSPEELQRAMNALLPPDVVVLRVEEAPPGFWPSRDASAKRYRYLIYDGAVRHLFLRRYAWQVDQRLDAEAMHRAAQCLVGTHDFASFQSRGSPRHDTIRTLFEVSVRRCGAGQGRAGGLACRYMEQIFTQSPHPGPKIDPFWTPPQDPLILCGLDGPILFETLRSSPCSPEFLAENAQQPPPILKRQGLPPEPGPGEPKPAHLEPLPEQGESLGPRPSGAEKARTSLALPGSRCPPEPTQPGRTPLSTQPTEPAGSSPKLAEEASGQQSGGLPQVGPQGDVIMIEVEGDGFLYHMVRAIVGTLVEVGRGNRPPEWVAEVLAARDRAAAGKTAPPEGLYLLYVRFEQPPPLFPRTEID